MLTLYVYMFVSDVFIALLMLYLKCVRQKLRLFN